MSIENTLRQHGFTEDQILEISEIQDGLAASVADIINTDKEALTYGLH